MMSGFRKFTLAMILMAIPAAGSATETAILAGGCFWCVESDFDSVDGVLGTVSGYATGNEPDATDKSSRIEAVQIEYDPDRVTFRQLADLLFRSIDPTDAGGQFCDRGEKYQSAIFFTETTQRSDAEGAAEAAAKLIGQPVVTRILSLSDFKPASDFHQNYYMRNETILTRFGLVPKSDAYKRYRKACGRDQRVREIWGSRAAFLD